MEILLRLLNCDGDCYVQAINKDAASFKDQFIYDIKDENGDLIECSANIKNENNTYSTEINWFLGDYNIKEVLEIIVAAGHTFKTDDSELMAWYTEATGEEWPEKTQSILLRTNDENQVLALYPEDGDSMTTIESKNGTTNTVYCSNDSLSCEYEHADGVFWNLEDYTLQQIKQMIENAGHDWETDDPAIEADTSYLPEEEPKTKTKTGYRNINYRYGNAWVVASLKEFAESVNFTIEESAHQESNLSLLNQKISQYDLREGYDYEVITDSQSEEEIPLKITVKTDDYASTDVSSLTNEIQEAIDNGRQKWYFCDNTPDIEIIAEHIITSDTDYVFDVK